MTSLIAMNPYTQNLWQTPIYDPDASSFTGIPASDSNGNIVAVMGSSVWSVSITGVVNWTKHVVGVVFTQASVLSDNTVVCGGDDQNIYFFAALDGTYTTLAPAFPGATPSWLCINIDGSIVVGGGGWLGKISIGRLSWVWAFKGPFWGLDPQIQGIIVDGNGNTYLWYDIRGGVYIYNSNGEFVKVIEDTGDVVDPDTGLPILLGSINTLVIADDESLIVSISSEGWNGIVSLQSGEIPTQATTTKYPMVNMSVHGIGNNVSVGEPWGP